MSSRTPSPGTNHPAALLSYHESQKQLIMKKLIPIAVGTLLCLGVGIVASFFQKDSIENWYPTLKKPALTPPNIVFPIAWSILYVCMGTSIGLIWKMKSPQRDKVVRLFALQLLLNFGWSISFFYCRSPWAGMIDILLLNALIVRYMQQSYRLNKASALLFAPYLTWTLFATYLNGYILAHN